jgi:ATPases of the AAA+ class
MMSLGNFTTTSQSNNSSGFIVIGLSDNTLILLLQIIVTLLFFLFPLIYFIVFSRRMGMTLKPKNRKPNATPYPSVSWDEIYDEKGVKERLEEIAKNVMDRGAYGVILFGPPGTGKSTLARALANKLKWSYFELRPSDVLSKWYGESEYLLESYFDNVESSSPSVLLIDEIDSLTMKREEDIHEVTHRLINIMLMRLQELHDKKVKVLIIGATNIPQEIDEAFLRPGRFDEVIYVPLPDEKGREEIWRGYIKAEGIDYSLLAKMSDRFSPADIKNIAEQVMGKKQNPTTEDFLSLIESSKPSVQISTIIKFETIAKKYSRAKISIKTYGVPEITWDDLGDLEEVKRVLRESVELPLLKRELAEKLKISPVKGILLYGPPGTGKTSIAKALSNDLKFNFIELSGEEISSSGPFESPKIIAEKFYIAIDNAPSVIFIDEIDMIARSRSVNEWRNALTELLKQMDGLREVKNVIVVGATNRPWDLDKAILRPGRFDKIIYVPPPDREARAKILKVLCKGLEVEERVIEEVASITDFYTPADLKLVIEEVRRKLLKEASSSGVLRTKIDLEDFKDVLGRVKPSIDRETLRSYEEFKERNWL